MALTKTKPDRKGLKEGVVETVRASVDKYTNLLVISFENLRSTKFKELRREWADDSRYVPATLPAGSGVRGRPLRARRVRGRVTHGSVTHAEECGSSLGRCHCMPNFAAVSWRLEAGACDAWACVCQYCVSD